MFDFNKFLMDAFMDGVSQGESRFTISMRAVPFFQGGSLTQSNMKAIDAALAERDAPKPEPEIDPGMTIPESEMPQPMPEIPSDTEQPEAEVTPEVTPAEESGKIQE